MKRYGCLCLLLFVSSTTVAENKFRRDYVYNSKTKAYYKLHIETKRYSSAELACETEGASLMVPSSEADTAQIHALLKQYPFIGDLVYLGKSEKNGVLESAEETPIIDLDTSDQTNDYPDSANLATKDCQVLTRDNEIRKDSCWASLPFACKAEESKLNYNEHCQTYIEGYKYYPLVAKCYKASNNVLIWTEAGDDCRNQGGYLVVLKSEDEHGIVKDVLRNAPSVMSSLNPICVLAGISAKAPSREFRTIFNQTLEEAGFATWNPGEPNNEGGEYCGCLIKSNGYYNDIPCWGRFGYICEKEASP